jgi:hypothetical protein
MVESSAAIDIDVLIRSLSALWHGWSATCIIIILFPIQRPMMKLLAREDGAMEGRTTDASEAASGYDGRQLVSESEAASDLESTAPRELVQEVAASLKSLSKILPYAEYAAIVHRIAQLRWRCSCAVAAGAPEDRH